MAATGIKDIGKVCTDDWSVSTALFRGRVRVGRDPVLSSSGGR